MEANAKQIAVRNKCEKSVVIRAVYTVYAVHSWLMYNNGTIFQNHKAIMNAVKMSQKNVKTKVKINKLRLHRIFHPVIGSVCGAGSPRSPLQASVADQHKRLRPLTEPLHLFFRE